MAQNENKDIKETAKHGIVYGLGQVAPNLVGFFLLPIFGRYLDPAEFGVWALLQSLTLVAVSVLGLGLDTASMRSFFDYSEIKERKKIVGISLLILFLIVCLFNLIWFQFSFSISEFIFQSNKYSQHLHLIGVTIGFKVLSTIPFVVFRAQKKSGAFILINSGITMSRFCLMSLSLIYSNYHVIGLIYCDMLISSFGLIVMLFSIKNYIHFGIHWIELKKMLTYGIPLVPGRFLYSALEIIDRYFVAEFLSLYFVGVYAIANKIGSVLQTLLATPFQLIFPAVTFEIEKKKYLNEYLRKIFTYYLVIGIVLCLGIAMFSAEILMIVGKKEYLVASKILPVILFSYLFHCMQQNFQMSAFLKRKTYWVPVIVTLGLLVNIISNFIFIKIFGMMGAAMSKLFTRILMANAWYHISKKYRKVNYEWIRVMKIAAVSATLFALSFIKLENQLVTVIYKILLLCSLPVVLDLIRFFNIEEKQKYFTIKKTLKGYFKFANN